MTHLQVGYSLPQNAPLPNENGNANKNRGRGAITFKMVEA